MKNRIHFCRSLVLALTGLWLALPVDFVFATNASEGTDFSNSAPGTSYTLTSGANTFSGTVTSPINVDGRDYFRVVVPAGLRITQVSKTVTDTSGNGFTGSVNFNNESLSGTGSANFNGAGVSPYPLSAGTYDAYVNGDFAVGVSWSVTITVGAAPDYSISTTSGIITVTDDAGNSDTLSITNPVAGSIKFAVAGRTFAINGGALLSNDSGNLSLSGVSDITVNCGNGSDTINVSAFSGSSFPSLSLYASSNDAVNLNGDITFAANKNLYVDLQNGSTNATVINVAANANLITSGTGTIDLYCCKNISFATGSSLEVQNGDLTVEANQQSTATPGNFVGVNLDGATIKSTGTGIVTVNGTGGNDAGGYQLGIQVINGAKIMGGNNFVFVAGKGGASTGIVNRGVTVYGAGSAITSANGSVYVTGTAGYVGSYYGIGVSILFGAEISSGDNGLLTVIGNGNGAVGSGYNMGIEMGSDSAHMLSAGREVTINAGAGPGASYGLYLANSAFITTPAAGGSIEFNVNSLAWDNSVNIVTTNGGSHVRFKAGSPSTKIDLGGADTTLTLGLSNDELARVSTANFEFYNPSGNIFITAPITNNTATNMTFLTAFAGGLIPTNAGVDISLPAGTVSLIQSSPLQCTINGSTADSGYTRLNVVGKVNLASTPLTINGTYAGAVGDTFTIIENDGNDPILGTFTGLPQGSYLNLNGQPARIFYNGGSGNDVVLVRALPQLTPSRGLTNGNWSFTGLGLPTNTYTIQATTNFITWTNVGVTVGNSNGAFTFTDSNAFRFKYRFYRTTN